jgi:hypothetical protein
LLLVVYYQPVKDAYRRYSTPDRVEGEVEVEGEVVGEVEGGPVHPEIYFYLNVAYLNVAYFNSRKKDKLLLGVYYQPAKEADLRYSVEGT